MFWRKKKSENPTMSVSYEISNGDINLVLQVGRDNNSICKDDEYNVRRFFDEKLDRQQFESNLFMMKKEFREFPGRGDRLLIDSNHHHVFSGSSCHLDEIMEYCAQEKIVIREGIEDDIKAYIGAYGV